MGGGEFSATQTVHVSGKSDSCIAHDGTASLTCFPRPISLDINLKGTGSSEIEAKTELARLISGLCAARGICDCTTTDVGDVKVEEYTSFWSKLLNSLAAFRTGKHPMMR